MHYVKIIIARYRAGIMTRQQVLDYIKVKYISRYDANIVQYIMGNIEEE